MKVIPFQVPKINKEAFRIQTDNAPKFYDKLHQHPENQIMLIKKGAGTLIAGDYVGRFSSGDLFLIGSNQPHVFRSDESTSKSKSRVSGISLYFDEKYAGENFWQLNELVTIRNFITHAGVGYRIENDTNLKLTKLIEDLIKLTGIERLLSFIQLLKTLSESQDLKSLSAAGSKIRFSGSEGKRMNDILQFSLTQSFRKVKIKEVADVANLSTEAFCRYFKLRTGKTYTNFLNEVRVSNACKMLIEKEKSIQEICFETGFANLSHFNRTFKKITRKTPTRYVT
jgi:AraC-like DNA-binding protein